MTAFALRAERIQARAREYRPLTLLLLLIASPLWALGWMVSKAWWLLWLVLSWILAAVETGWQDGRPRKGGP